MPTLKQFTADHRYAIKVVRRAGFVDPILFDADDLADTLLKHAAGGEPLAFDGALIPSWADTYPSVAEHIALGMRIWTIEGLRFCSVDLQFDRSRLIGAAFFVVERRDYKKLREIGTRLSIPPRSQTSAPVMHDAQRQQLWENTIAFLDRKNLDRFKKFGVRAHRGVLLSGPPGNGKTMACRWILEECSNRGWEHRLVTPDNYRAARQNDAVAKLFRVYDRGIVFFDDMDLALRGAATNSAKSEDQSVFLTALDGMRVNSGVVFVFTSNCPLESIDRAFRRPGRIDLGLTFKLPDAELRRRLVRTWHAELREQIVEDQVVAATDGNSFAEIDELKNSAAGAPLSEPRPVGLGRSFPRIPPKPHRSNHRPPSKTRLSR